ncbi:serine/threonine-protein kinase [Nocardia stercoris]|uniref:serine/threonine-protein kinase n=1 Tax=Nocardia stercoris TaxID=2483361 RepID=UPI002278536F|nr:serine/threonine-protein kinase [Nocardia stercoris]
MGTRFGAYELRSLLGRGGMGEVYLAYDSGRDRVVALKLLRAELTDDPVFRRRFRRESHTAAQMNEPHVIPIHDWGEIDGILYIDMRLVAGNDLKTVLAGGGPLPPERCVALVEQVAAALDAAHTAGLVHRDVKPANILVTPSDFAYLCDFGIAQASGDSTLTAADSLIGSYAYMAPERFDSGPTTAHADVYALACILYECLTGSKPFPADSITRLITAHLSGPIPLPSRHAPVSDVFDSVVARGMAKDPAARYRTAGDLAAAARAALTGGRPAEPPTHRIAAVDAGDETRDSMVGVPAAPPIAYSRIDSIPPQQISTSHRVSAPPQAQPQGAGSTQGGGSPQGQVTPQVSGSQRIPLGQHAAPPIRLPASLPVPTPATRAIPAVDRQAAPAAPPRRRRRVWPAVLIVVLLAVAGAGGVAAYKWKTTKTAPGVAISFPAGTTQCRPPDFTPTLGPQNGYTHSAVGPNTRCPFAENVRQAYGAGPRGTDRTVNAHSPTTQQDYDMHCVPQSVVVVCSGGNNAVVYLY